MSKSLWRHGLYSPWNTPGQNTGVGSLFLLQRIFPTQGSNPGFPHCRLIFFYQLSHKGSPFIRKLCLFYCICHTFICIKNITYIFKHLTGNSRLHPKLLSSLYCARRSCEVSKCPSDRNAGRLPGINWSEQTTKCL